MNTFGSCIFILSATVAANSLWGEQSAQQGNGGITYADKLRDIYDLVKPVVRVEGRVVDEEGQPVQGADVILYWGKATYLLGKGDDERTETIRTDRDGRWNKTLEKPLRTLIDTIRKDGYEYSGENNSKTYSRDLVYEPLPNGAPFVSVLRKRGEPTFLLLSKKRNFVDEPLFQIDNGKDARVPVDILSWMDKNKAKVPYVDLLADASFDAGTRKWRLTFCATNSPDGLVSGDRLLYEAPATGYAPQATMTLEAREGKAYLYLRSRRPVVYSRIALTYWHADAPTGRERIRVSYDVCINPYGERNLEYDERAESVDDLVKALSSEAVDALFDGKKPPKPDIPQRVKDSRETEKRKAVIEELRKSDPESLRIKAENDRKLKEWQEKRSQKEATGEK